MTENKDEKITWFDEREKVEIVLSRQYTPVIENGRLYIVKNKYPKTYEESCEVLNLLSTYNVCIKTASVTYDEILDTLYRLMVCRDAFWKICDNWSPDWNNDKQIKYVITFDNGIISHDYFVYTSKYIFAFPNEEISRKFLQTYEPMLRKITVFL